MATKHQKVKIFIGEGYNQRERKKIADELIDVMVTQAELGKGLYGTRRKSFPKYSKKYFKYGEDVDLVLSGEMLNAIDVLESTDDSLTIGFEDGTLQNAKADGNIRGTYGKSRANSKKARPFLGVTASELNDILSDFD